MKRIIAVFIASSVFLVGCSQSFSDSVNPTLTTESIIESSNNTSIVGYAENVENNEAISLDEWDVDLDPTNYGNPELLSYIEDNLYLGLIDEMAADGDYYIEEVRASYVSQEYIDELNYNSQPNVYFGYTLEQIDHDYQGARYVFTLGDDGQTVIETYEAYDGAYEKIMKNVAIGTGVIIVCVVVAVATGGAALPAECATISLIFTSAAEGATIGALTTGLLNGGIAAAVKGVETGDMNKALRAGLVSGSEGYASGAIIGGLTSGVGQGIQILNIARNFPNEYLSATQIARLQRSSKLPLEILSKIETTEECEVLSAAGLRSTIVGKRLAMIRDIDLNYISPTTISETNPSGLTNLQLMMSGKAPFDPVSGLKYELHHIGQRMDSPLAILTSHEHDLIPNLIQESQISRSAFGLERAEFWRTMAAMLGG